MNVPFLDLRAQYDLIRDEIARAVQSVMENTAFAGGPFVEKFEEEFAAYCGGCRYAVGVGSGTEALWLALLAIGVGPGDEVITAPNSFIATAEAISYCGAKPVFVDIDEKTYTMDPRLLEAAISERTKAIVPVHLFGQSADMDPIVALGRKYGIPIIEDAAQAHGAKYKGRRVGSLGVAGCFSFYPGKNLGAYGEAGAVTTNDGSIAEAVRLLRDHGQASKHNHTMVGWNARMDGIQAAVLSVKLKRIDEWNSVRRQKAEKYRQGLSGVEGIMLPTAADYAEHVYHIYAIRVGNRDDLIRYLAERGIQCAVHYPVPIHLQPAYESLQLAQNEFPIAEKCAAEYVSLPLYAELTDDEVAYVCRNIKEWCGQASAVMSGT